MPWFYVSCFSLRLCTNNFWEAIVVQVWHTARRRAPFQNLALILVCWLFCSPNRLLGMYNIGEMSMNQYGQNCFFFLLGNCSALVVILMQTGCTSAIHAIHDMTIHSSGRSSMRIVRQSLLLAVYWYIGSFTSHSCFSLWHDWKILVHWSDWRKTWSQILVL